MSVNPAINLPKLIADKELDAKRLAEALFPDIAYKSKALRRVIELKQPLTTPQLIALAEYSQVAIPDLFTNYLIP